MRDGVPADGSSPRAGERGSPPRCLCDPLVRLGWWNHVTDLCTRSAGGQGEAGRSAPLSTQKGEGSNRPQQKKPLLTLPIQTLDKGRPALPVAGDAAKLWGP